MSNVKRMTHLKLGEILVREGLLEEQDLLTALERQQFEKLPLGQILVNLDLCREMDIAKAIANQFALPFLSIEQCYIKKELFDMFPVDFMRNNLVIPLDQFGNILVVLLGGMLDEASLQQIESVAQCELQVYVGCPSEILSAIENHENEKKREAEESSTFG